MAVRIVLLFCVYGSKHGIAVLSPACQVTLTVSPLHYQCQGHFITLSLVSYQASNVGPLPLPSPSYQVFYSLFTFNPSHTDRGY